MMLYAEYVPLAKEAADQFEEGRPAETVDAFRRLLDSDISDLDKTEADRERSTHGQGSIGKSS